MTRTVALVPALALSLALALPATAAQMHARRGPYQLQVLVNGQPVSPYWFHDESWILGHLGERYTLRVLNRSPRPIEAVVSVDGRDVIDGQTASPQKGGYLVPAYGQVDIDGWRISSAQAAAFRFSSVGNSYAAQTGSGREVGVIGVAVFTERVRPPPPVISVRKPASWEESCCAGASNQPADKKDFEAQGPIGGAVNGADGELARRSESAGEAAPPPPSASPAKPSAPASSAPAPATERLADSGSAMGHASAQARAKASPGLGTEYGEAVDSEIRQVQFERASSSPACVLGARYNDRDGFIAMGFDFDRLAEQGRRASADPFPVVERGYAPPPPNWNR